MNTASVRPGLKMLTLQETAELLSVAPATLYAWRHRGLGPRGFRIEGGLVRYRLADVESWLEQQADEPRRAV